MSYRPSPTSLAGRVIDYLTRNPDTSLTVSAIKTRFIGVGEMRDVHDQLVTACDFGYLEWHPRKGSGGIYCLGSGSPQDEPFAANCYRQTPPGLAELSRVLPFRTGGAQV